MQSSLYSIVSIVVHRAMLNPIISCARCLEALSQGDMNTAMPTDIAGFAAKSRVSVVESSGRIVKFVEDIGDSTKEQPESVSLISMGIEQISLVVQTNSATAEESAAAASQINMQAQGLKDMVDTFKLRSN